MKKPETISRAEAQRAQRKSEACDHTTVQRTRRKTVRLLKTTNYQSGNAGYKKNLSMLNVASLRSLRETAFRFSFACLAGFAQDRFLRIPRKSKAGDHATAQRTRRETVKLYLRKIVVHEKHEIHELNQKDIQLHGITCLVNYYFALMV